MKTRYPAALLLTAALTIPACAQYVPPGVQAFGPTAAQQRQAEQHRHAQEQWARMTNAQRLAVIGGVAGLFGFIGQAGNAPATSPPARGMPFRPETRPDEPKHPLHEEEHVAEPYPCSWGYASMGTCVR